MKIKSAEFVKGIVQDDALLRDGKPQIVFIGRSNVGKSSLINSLAGRKVARSSSRPGKTREINLYLINKDFYFVDLPGYGFARASQEDRDNLKKLIYSYLLFGDIDHHRIVMIIDAVVGVTDNDAYFIRRLEEQNKELVIIANKIDKVKKSELAAQTKKIRQQIGEHELLLCSTKTQMGISEIWNLLAKNL